ncbi:unnamed protein product [Amoebophrya sp. A25]|nr:unnamed protein product [Amoebophrya sp. A25]|eukprot:GSA25T00023188001.1
MSSDFDEAYVADCRQLQNGITQLQTATQDIHRELRSPAADSASLLETRGRIDVAIAQISDLQTVLKRLRAYTVSCQDTAEKAQKRSQYQQLSQKLQAAAKDLEAEIQQYIKACNSSRGAVVGGSSSSSSTAGASSANIAGTTSASSSSSSSTASSANNSRGLTNSNGSTSPSKRPQTAVEMSSMGDTRTTPAPRNDGVGGLGNLLTNDADSTSSSTNLYNHDINNPYAYESNYGSNPYTSNADLLDPFSPSSGTSGNQTQKTGLLYPAQEVTDAELERGRLQQMLNVQGRMEDLQNIYVDLSEHVMRASENFGSIEAHVLRTAEMTHDAVNEIKITANRDFRSYYRRASAAMLFILFLLWNMLF